MLDAPNLAQARVGNMAAGYGSASYGDDSQVLVEFYKEPVYNEYRSLAEGKAIYDERIFLKMLIPGDKTKQPVRYAQLEHDMNTGTPPDSDRWPRAWAAFKNGEAAAHDGTALAMWPVMNRHQVEEFRRLNIHTIEQLSTVPDGTLHQLGSGARTVRDMAVQWIERASGDKDLTKMEAKHTAEIAEMQAKIDSMMAMFENATDPEKSKRGPGRPKREEADDI